MALRAFPTTPQGLHATPQDSLSGAGEMPALLTDSTAAAAASPRQTFECHLAARQTSLRLLCVPRLLSSPAQRPFNSLREPPSGKESSAARWPRIPILFRPAKLAQGDHFVSAWCEVHPVAGAIEIDLLPDEHPGCSVVSYLVQLVDHFRPGVHVQRAL
jgi:hypothetical protein